MTYNLEQHARDRKDIWTLLKSIDMFPEISKMFTKELCIANMCIEIDFSKGMLFPKLLID